MSKMILIAGPCSIENDKVPMEVCEGILKTLEKYPQVDFIFKGSWKKANRTKLSSFTGLDIDKSLNIFQKIKDTFKVRVLTDVHETTDIKELESVIDVFQTPAYLMRQTDLLIAAAKSKPVNIKKAQYASPQDAGYAVEKALSTGQKEVFLCERGTSFGYDTLVVDYSSLPLMKKFGVPVLLDATHCLQRKNNGISGGQRDLVPHMMNAAVAVGVDGIFAEVHSDIDNAQSDKESQIKLEDFHKIFEKCMEFREVVLKG
jgi:2-dehydro-3-deoxyphosphooctonate aldolase (KDO 8-P synthase)